ncbi:cystinosin homolog isoform X3 [Benincasa hispida]|uniref:cystinosin homolog isoform X3 n=1 Tax=Benincasa hispida TaxID=102211 RepID=UPI001900B371|nr:cystinosin homolog isoform X3 [Benincasa hispida]
MGSWNSISMEIIYQVLGWISIICWALASYPQVILNFRRKSVVGLSFDYVMLNCTKQSSYLIYNATLFFSSTVQRQYFDKYGYDQMIPVALSDVFFPFHSILLISVVSVQIVFFDRGNQKVSKTSIAIFVAVWFFAAACFFMALPTHSWLWLVSIFNSIQVFMTFIKYSPQAFLNFTRKSTVGFSIGNIVLDFTGGVGTLAQMSVQSIDQGSWVNFFGNIGKPLLALVSIGFDLIFFYQHFVLYHIKASRVSFQRDPESTEPLIKDSDHLQGIATTS